ncbi:hypothetical protein [Emticicia sp.]|uniref:hypothetical protein n=1 Tax=Emticicia sp. TaxID=1930953 RepID=UPI0037523A51
MNDTNVSQNYISEQNKGLIIKLLGGLSIYWEEWKGLGKNDKTYLPQKPFLQQFSRY